MAASLRAALARLGWPVSVLTTSGTDSVRPKRDTAIRAINVYRRAGVRTVIGHLSDLDEHGLSLADAFAEDVTAFADEHEPGCVTVERVALTPKQVAEHGLPTNPGKRATRDRSGRLWVPPGGTSPSPCKPRRCRPTSSSVTCGVYGTVALMASGRRSRPQTAAARWRRSRPPRPGRPR